jgi:ABC-type phosphate/phosphonate transport system ATPase subunit
MQIIAIGGEPGSGKSTLMKRIIKHYGVDPKYNEVKLVPYLQKGNIYILGKYEEGEVFSGTDRMSMAVQPEAIKFCSSLPDNSIVLFEGDRLFTASFLEDCMDKYNLEIIHLFANKDIQKQRYLERGSEQNETWLRGRETKIANILSNMNLLFNVSSYRNNNIEDQTIIYDAIIKHCGE